MGWKSREEIKDGWAEPTSLRRWIAMLDGKSLRFLEGWMLDDGDDERMSPSVLWRKEAKGLVDIVDDEIDMLESSDAASLSEESKPLPQSDRRRRLLR